VLREQGLGLDIAADVCCARIGDGELGRAGLICPPLVVVQVVAAKNSTLKWMHFSQIPMWPSRNAFKKKKSTDRPCQKSE
jgi:hypothetical protein